MPFEIKLQIRGEAIDLSDDVVLKKRLGKADKLHVNNLKVLFVHKGHNEKKIQIRRPNLRIPYRIAALNQINDTSSMSARTHKTG